MVVRASHRILYTAIEQAKGLSEQLSCMYRIMLSSEMLPIETAEKEYNVEQHLVVTNKGPP